MRLQLTRPVRALVCDVDGCLVGVGHRAFDLHAMGTLAELNRQSRADPAVPPLTLLTGRPHPYVDALMQVLDVSVVASFENGAGLATRHPYRAWVVDGIEGGVERVRRFAGLVEARPHLTLQVGKIASATVFPRDPSRDLGSLVDEVESLVRQHDLDLVIDPSNDCVNVLVPGVDKASGFGRLCAALGLDEDEVAGVGDSVGDVAWLRRCAAAFVPANASADVRGAVASDDRVVVSHARDVTAAVEAYRAVVEANRRL